MSQESNLGRGGAAPGKQRARNKSDDEFFTSARGARASILAAAGTGPAGDASVSGGVPSRHTVWVRWTC